MMQHPKWPNNEESLVTQNNMILLPTYDNARQKVHLTECINPQIRKYFGIFVVSKEFLFYLDFIALRLF